MSTNPRPQDLCANQLIFTGSSDHIQAFVQREPALVEIETFDLCKLVNPASTTHIAVYGLTSGAPERLHSLVEQANAEADLTAEVNCVVGRNPTPVRGDSVCWEGGAISATAYDGLPQDFANQWAFQAIGLNDPRVDGLRGEGVRVGIFDNFAFEGLPAFGFELAFKPVGVADHVKPIIVKSGHPLENLREDEPEQMGDVPNHGIFTAGLVRGVAPESEIWLYPRSQSAGTGQCPHPHRRPLPVCR